MKYCAIDCETRLIEPDNKTPQLVCVSIAIDGMEPALYAAVESVPILKRLFTDPELIFIFHNAPFDLAVFRRFSPALGSLIWSLYEQGRVRDTNIREKLIDIRSGMLSKEKGAYSLGFLVKKYFNKNMIKDDTGWRLRYNELEQVPIEEWPQAAKEYALDDAAQTLNLFKYQERILQNAPLPPGEEIRQVKAHWALHLTSLRGLRTDPIAVERLASETVSRIDSARVDLAKAGIYHFKKNSTELKLNKEGEPTRNMAAIKGLVKKAYESRHLVAPLTDKGNVVTDTLTLEESGDPILQKLAGISSDVKIQTSYIPLLRKCVSKRIQTNFNPLQKTGRTSSFDPNIQQWPRNGDVRACLIPEDGYVFVGCDYDTLELRCLAQILLWRFGKSEMADAIKSGRDLHLMVAAQLTGVDYETAVRRLKEKDPIVKSNRQRAKMANFGFAGGMGAATFVKHAATQGLTITLEYAFELRAKWLQTWPEMHGFFIAAAEHTGDLGDKTLTHWVSGRQVADLGFSDYCNYQFQGLAADGAKAALYETVKLCNLDDGNPLFGSHPCNFVHDSIELESPIANASRAAFKLKEVMESKMQLWVPDIPITATVALSRRGYKDAAPVYNDRGELIPWEPTACTN